MLRYKSTGVARCSAMAVGAIRARAPIASTRPPAEQKIHAGKKEPRILYSGAWEQPANTSGAAKDNPARARNEVVRGRSLSVDSMFTFNRPHICPKLVCLFSTTTCFALPRVAWPAMLFAAIERSIENLSFTFRLSHELKGLIYWTKVSTGTFVSVDRVGACMLTVDIYIQD